VPIPSRSSLSAIRRIEGVAPAQPTPLLPSMCEEHQSEDDGHQPADQRPDHELDNQRRMVVFTSDRDTTWIVRIDQHDDRLADRVLGTAVVQMDHFRPLSAIISKLDHNVARISIYLLPMAGVDFSNLSRNTNSLSSQIVSSFFDYNRGDQPSEQE
jgi:hypothetical protein